MHDQLSKAAHSAARPQFKTGAPEQANFATKLASPASLRRFQSTGIDLIAVVSQPLTELHATVTPVGNEPPEFTVRRLAELLNAWDATPVRTIAFGSLRGEAATRAALRQSLDDPELPLAWVEGSACDGRLLAGIQVHAVTGAHVRTLTSAGLPLGRTWRDTTATHCVFSGLGEKQSSTPRPEQTRSALMELNQLLAGAGMTFAHVARTWFYLDNILAWYDDFNGARNAFFASANLAPGKAPASTGVSGRNPHRSALSLAAWAVKANDPAARVVQIVPSPRQCPAPAYGSAFSRAVEIQSPGFRQLLVSGTASIAPNGETAHVGDVDAQIECTMEVIEAILESRGMTLGNATRATAYYRSPLDAPRFANWLERRELRSLPVVHTCCDICRDDLLFELELDAILAP